MIGHGYHLSYHGCNKTELYHLLSYLMLFSSLYPPSVGSGALLADIMWLKSQLDVFI